MATIFQQAVWKALEEIPRGRVTTYAQVAQYIGRPKAVRAVGSACAANLRLVVVPCHRVVSASGDIGEYARGRTEKIALLREEGVEVSEKGVIENWEQALFSYPA